MKTCMNGERETGGRHDSPSASRGVRKRIMIVDDHPLVCEGLAALIQQDEGLEVVAVSHTVPDAQRALREQLPDLLLLDISLPRANGLDVLKDLRIHYPEMKILVVSMHDESVYAEHVVRLGAKGYIMKAASSDKIVEAVQHVLEGGIYASPRVLSKILARLSSMRSRSGAPGGAGALTERELQVYTLIGEGFKAREIAESLKISPKTVQTHREHIKKKLGFSTSAELNQSAWNWCKNQ
ncbi:MAG: response regulator transcription factor [Kiritimatiellia bacterium]|jgi:DNA-binding NarL/FixJ family response regulator